MYRNVGISKVNFENCWVAIPEVELQPGRTSGYSPFWSKKMKKKPEHLLVNKIECLHQHLLRKRASW
jgi:hypothetical protein